MKNLYEIINLPHFSSTFFDKYKKRLGNYPDIFCLENEDVYEIEEKMFILLKERYCEDMGFSSIRSDCFSFEYSSLKGNSRKKWESLLKSHNFIENCRYKSIVENYFNTNCLDQLVEKALHG